MDKKFLIAQTSYGEQISTDLVSGYQSWTGWSLGLITAALGLMMLALLARFTLNRF
ncbi:MAG: hypothetical protein AAFN42_23775 [Cyanobacteria bacterium J06554_1]